MLLPILVGCSSMATQRLSANLASSIVNQDDPATVRAAIPAYLLLMEGMLRDDPQNPRLLVSVSKLYGAYAGSLVAEPARSRKLYEHARAYARKALCIKEPAVCEAENRDFQAFSASLENFDISSLNELFVYATRYADWIGSDTGDWNSLMFLPYVEAMLQKVVSHEPGYANGRAQLYLAVMSSQLPASLGGSPESGRKHFEMALQYSQGRDLMVKVMFAQTYARLVFDQALHDRLLNEVVESNPLVEDLTLSNVLAKNKAQTLLKDGYF